MIDFWYGVFDMLKTVSWLSRSSTQKSQLMLLTLHVDPGWQCFYTQKSKSFLCQIFSVWMPMFPYMNNPVGWICWAVRPSAFPELLETEMYLILDLILGMPWHVKAKFLISK